MKIFRKLLCSCTSRFCWSLSRFQRISGWKRRNCCEITLFDVFIFYSEYMMKLSATTEDIILGKMHVCFSKLFSYLLKIALPAYRRYYNKKNTRLHFKLISLIFLSTEDSKIYFTLLVCTKRSLLNISFSVSFFI